MGYPYAGVAARCGYPRPSNFEVLHSPPILTKVWLQTMSLPSVAACRTKCSVRKALYVSEISDKEKSRCSGSRKLLNNELQRSLSHGKLSASSSHRDQLLREYVQRIATFFTMAKLKLPAFSRL